MLKQLFLIASLATCMMLSSAVVHGEVSIINQYDPNGNLVSGDGKYYEYNDANQLARVRENDQNGKVIAEYFYDFTRQRVKKVENGVTTYYIGKHYETNVVAGKAENTSYFFADGERVAKKVRTADGTLLNTSFYHPDHLDGVNAVTDAAGAVVAKTSYLPFGEVRQGGQEKFSYTGKEKDKATDLYYFDARFNSPELRHFTQADSADADLSDPQDLNRYAYVGNNPLSYVDPDGHKKKHHSKKEEKALAKQRAAANAQKKANKKAEEKQRAAADYAKHHPASVQSGQVGAGYSLASNSEQMGGAYRFTGGGMFGSNNASKKSLFQNAGYSNHPILATEAKTFNSPDTLGVLIGSGKTYEGLLEFGVGAIGVASAVGGCATIVACAPALAIAAPSLILMVKGEFDLLDGVGDLYSEFTNKENPFDNPLDWGRIDAGF